MKAFHYLFPIVALTASAVQAQEADCVTATAAASTTSYKAGESFYIAMQAEVAQPWHAYFRNPATIGEPLAAELKAPAGFTVKGPYYSAPERHESPIGVAYIYQHATIVWQVTPEANAPANATFTATTTAQCCSDEGCNPPETDKVEVKLAAGDGAADPAWKGQERQVEKLGEEKLDYKCSQSGNSVTIKLPTLTAAKEVYFFSDDNCINPTAKQAFSGGELKLQRNDNKDVMYPVKNESQVGKPLKKLRGMLVADGKVYTIKASFKAVK